MSAQTQPPAAGEAAHYWHDPATAQLENGKWVCSVRGGLTPGIICWAEGESSGEARDRAKTITRSLNSHAGLVAALDDIEAMLTTDPEAVRKCRAIARAELAKAKGGAL
jgi:hypothetical protein